MLILSRKIDERIRIGADVWVMVTKIKGEHVLLGIEAPPSVRIFREELLPQQLEDQNDDAQRSR